MNGENDKPEELKGSPKYQVFCERLLSSPRLEEDPLLSFGFSTEYLVRFGHIIPAAWSDVDVAVEDATSTYILREQFKHSYLLLLDAVLAHPLLADRHVREILNTGEIESYQLIFLVVRYASRLEDFARIVGSIPSLLAPVLIEGYTRIIAQATHDLRFNALVGAQTNMDQAQHLHTIDQIKELFPPGENEFE